MVCKARHETCRLPIYVENEMTCVGVVAQRQSIVFYMVVKKRVLHASQPVCAQILPVMSEKPREIKLHYLFETLIVNLFARQKHPKFPLVSVPAHTIVGGDFDAQTMTNFSNTLHNRLRIQLPHMPVFSNAELVRKSFSCICSRENPP